MVYPSIVRTNGAPQRRPVPATQWGRLSGPLQATGIICDTHVKSLWDPSRPAAALCVSPLPRAVQYRLPYRYQIRVSGMDGRRPHEDSVRRGLLVVKKSVRG